MSKIPREHKIIDSVECALCSKCKKFFPLNFFGRKIQSLDGLNSQCKQCVSNYTKTTTERRKSYMKKYADDNKEKISQYKKDWAKSNPRDRSEYFESYRNSHKKQYKEWFKEHFKKPEAKQKYRINCIKRRSIKKKTISTATLSDWQECLKFFNNRDAYTGKLMIIPSQDHFIPLSKGGMNTKHNIIPCEKSINSSKNDADFEIWYRKQPFFSEKRLKKIYKWIGYDEKTNSQQLSII